MFGIPSIGKLMVLAAVLAVVWYGFKFLGRVKEARSNEAKLRESAGRPAAKRRPGSGAALETVQCPVCEAYLPSNGASNCGRADCPY